MKRILKKLYEAFRIFIMVAAAHKLGWLEWIEQNIVLAYLIFSALEYLAFRPDGAEEKTNEK